MSNIVVSNPAVMQVMSEKIAKSNLFGFKSPDQAYALLMLSEAKGLHPMALLEEYHIINNRPALKSSAVMSKFIKSGGTVDWHRLDDEVAEATFSHPSGGTLKMKWTIEKAKQAGIYDTNPVWKKYPSNMLRSRLFSDAVSALNPACLDGAITESQAQDIPQEEVETELIELESVDIKQLKRDLSRALTKLQIVDADQKTFFDKYVGEDTEKLSELVESEKLLLEKVNEFEKGE